ncbi:MAG: glycosyltransferase [Phycisphaerales bacterium]
MIFDPTDPPLEHKAAPPSPTGPLNALNRRARIALAHDWLVAYRGGEAVLEAIIRRVLAHGHSIPRIYTMFDSGTSLGPTIDALPRTTAPINRWPARARRWLLPLYPRAVANLSVKLARDHADSPYDLLISTSSAAIKGLTPPPGVPHLCYCHAPARYLWSQSEQYGLGRGGLLRRAGLRVFGPSLRAWDRRTARGVTRFLANSTHIAAEIGRRYGATADVLWPPVRTAFFTPPDSATGAAPVNWLYAGAIEPYKRVDLAIAAANASRTPLTIVGEGTQAAHLRAIAGPTVRFVGRVTDEQMREHYRAASLLLFPQVEDFGIVAVEAQACGTPVLAFGAGGALDSVVDGVTGAFFRDPTPQSLIAAAATAPRKSARVSADCRANAERFSSTRFVEAFDRHLNELLRMSGVTAA